MSDTPRQAIDPTEAHRLIARVGPHLGCGDLTHYPAFPEGRQDVCAIRHTAENGSDYGYDTIYLVWRGDDGALHHRPLRDTRSSKDYLHIRSITVDGENVKVEYGSGGSFSGSPWNSQAVVSI